MKQYCWHVASVVGILSASIFGATNPRTLEYAEKLGLAFQLTNIIRDVGEDARKGRIYLPINELQQFGVTAADLLNARHSEKFENLMRFQVTRAKQAYVDAFALLPAEDRRAQRPGLMMAAIYRAVLEEIERDRFQVLNQRISLTPLRKLWLAWKTYIRG
jgi:phytoene synthase